jgi:hypothetical protein
VAYSTDPDEAPIPYVHPNQTSIPEPGYKAGQLGPCFWCGVPAVYGQIDIGGKRRVDACRHHYEFTIAPAFAERNRIREEARKARAVARASGKKKR